MAARMLPTIFIYSKQEAMSRTIQVDYIISRFIYKRVPLAESTDILIVVCYITIILHSVHCLKCILCTHCLRKWTFLHL